MNREGQNVSSYGRSKLNDWSFSFSSPGAAFSVLALHKQIITCANELLLYC